MNSSLFRRADDPTRRAFVLGAARGMLGLSTVPLWSATQGLGSLAGNPLAGGSEEVPLRPATAKRVIYLFMSGGMSQMDTFDPKPGSDNQGPVTALRTNADDLLVSQYFPEMSRHMDKVAVCSSINSNQGAHAQGQYYMHTAYAPRGTVKHPSMGAWLSLMAGRLNPTLPGHVLVGGGSGTATGGFLPSAHYPLPIGNPETGLEHGQRPPDVSEELFHDRLDKLEAMNKGFLETYQHGSVQTYADMYEEALRLMRSDDLAAFDLNEESEELRAAYGENPFGQGCLLARRLAEHDVRFTEVVLGGWDTHTDNFDRVEELGGRLDGALSALLADLDARGLLEDTLVVLATEFGRTPRLVANGQGRNHYPRAFTCLLAGGGVRGGQRYGETDKDGEEVIADGASVKDFQATIAYALGLPHDHEVISPARRPFTIADGGRPITRLFA